VNKKKRSSWSLHACVDDYFFLFTFSRYCYPPTNYNAYGGLAVICGIECTQKYKIMTCWFLRLNIYTRRRRKVVYYVLLLTFYLKYDGAKTMVAAAVAVVVEKRSKYEYKRMFQARRGCLVSEKQGRERKQQSFQASLHFFYTVKSPMMLHDVMLQACKS